MRCLNCHYSLEGLPEHRCPECGRAFDPNDPHTFQNDGMSPQDVADRAKRLPIRHIAIVAVIAYVVSLGGFLWDSRWHPDLDLRTRVGTAAYDAICFWPFAFAIVFVLYLLLWRLPLALMASRIR